MTDLNLLYGPEDNLMGDQMGAKDGGMYSSQLSGQQLHKMASQNTVDQEEKQQQLQQLQQMQQQQMQQQVQQQQQQQQQQQVQSVQRAQTVQQKAEYDGQSRRKMEYNFMDRMNMKKGEVIKLALFSLVIVLGISIDRMITFYISKYIGDNVLTDFQELLLRISYPIGIFLLLWIFKAI